LGCLLCLQTISLYQLVSLVKKREDLRPSNVEFSLVVLPPMYKRGEYVLIANPEFTPLFSTIITSRYLVGQTITSTIIWNDCHVIGYASAMFISSSISQVTKFTYYMIAQVTCICILERGCDLFNISTRIK